MKLEFCRICKSKNLRDYLNLGETPPADTFLVTADPEHQSYFPLEVCVCDDCGMSQLNYTVPPETLYQNDYPYESSTTKTGREHFHEMASEIVDNFEIERGGLVVDIGSNVGVLLQGFKNQNCKVLGIEPAQNIADMAILKGIDTKIDFISPSLARAIVKDFGKADAVCITNVFAHIHDLDDLMISVDTMLSKNGGFVIEAPHFLSLVEHLEYDTIYHEHLLYITIKPLNSLFAKYDFVVTDVKKVSIHGGSVRIYVSRVGVRDVSPNVETVVQEEIAAGLFDIENLREFSQKVAKHGQSLKELLLQIKESGACIAAVSAPAKGMTLLNYCGIDRSIIDFVTEKSALKVGKFTPGGLIPVLTDEHLLQAQPEYALLLAWNFKNEIKENLREYSEAGGKFIIPIPNPIFE